MLSLCFKKFLNFSSKFILSFCVLFSAVFFSILPDNNVSAWGFIEIFSNCKRSDGKDTSRYFYIFNDAELKEIKSLGHFEITEYKSYVQDRIILAYINDLDIKSGRNVYVVNFLPEYQSFLKVWLTPEGINDFLKKKYKADDMFSIEANTMITIFNSGLSSKKQVFVC